MYDDRLHDNHTQSPPISIYLTSDEAPSMRQLSCIWCKRTIADIKGNIGTMIGTPMPTTDFGVAINIRCKLCKQNYRLLLSQPILR